MIAYRKENYEEKTGNVGQEINKKKNKQRDGEHITKKVRQLELWDRLKWIKNYIGRGL